MKTNREGQEQTWIKRIKLFGSKKDAELLVRAYYDEIYIFVLRQINDAETALDLTQEIFISMLQSIYAYKKEMADFRTWLYRIATNKVIDYRRKYVPDIETIADKIIMVRNHKLFCFDSLENICHTLEKQVVNGKRWRKTMNLNLVKKSFGISQ